jgi:hypothetical protein
VVAGAPVQFAERKNVAPVIDSVTTGSAVAFPSASAPDTVTPPLHAPAASDAGGGGDNARLAKVPALMLSETTVEIAGATVAVTLVVATAWGKKPKD